MTEELKLKIFSDGGSRGNPGPAAAGIYLEAPAEKVRLLCGNYLGVNTNNFAEYQGAILGLEKALQVAKDPNKTTVNFYMDSALVVNQLKGTFRLKAANLWQLREKVKDLESRFALVNFQHIPREMNKMADSAVNEALDKKKSFSRVLN